MRIKVLSVMMALLLTVGCATKTPAGTSVPAPNLPANARDAADANAFRVIADAYAFLNSVSNSVTSGKLTLTPAQKTVFNDTATAYNTAYALGLSYHNGASSNATSLTNATNALQSNLTTASAQITVPK